MTEVQEDAEHAALKTTCDLLQERVLAQTPEGYREALYRFREDLSHLLASRLVLHITLTIQDLTHYRDHPQETIGEGARTYENPGYTKLSEYIRELKALRDRAQEQKEAQLGAKDDDPALVIRREFFQLQLELFRFISHDERGTIPENSLCRYLFEEDQRSLFARVYARDGFGYTQSILHHSVPRFPSPVDRNENYRHIPYFFSHSIKGFNVPRVVSSGGLGARHPISFERNGIWDARAAMPGLYLSAVDGSYKGWHNDQPVITLIFPYEVVNIIVVYLGYTSEQLPHEKEIKLPAADIVLPMELAVGVFWYEDLNTQHPTPSWRTTPFFGANLLIPSDGHFKRARERFLEAHPGKKPQFADLVWGTGEYPFRFN